MIQSSLSLGLFLMDIVIFLNNSLVMNQHLSNYSIVSLYSFLQQRQLFITAQSLIKNKIFLSDMQSNDFENSLFYIETEGNSMQFKTAIEYNESVYLKHKISRKYMCLSIDEEEEKDTRYKVVLGNERHAFKISPCYQYQTKISHKIKFNEEIFLTTEYAGSRSGKVLIENADLFLAFNQGSKLQLHLHSIHEKEVKGYKHGRIVWLSHIESDNFLGIGTVSNKQEVVFLPIRYDKQIQDLKALWTINSNNLTVSNDLKFEEEIRLKNLYNGQYLCFSRNYRLVDNERIYQIYLEDQGSEFSKFIMKPIKEVDKKEIVLNSYMSVLHAESGLFLGCRKDRVGEYFKLLTFQMMDGEDLFQINGFGPEEEQALRFIFVIRKEFQSISAFINHNQSTISLPQINDIYQTYANVLHQLISLKNLEKLYEFVRNELGSSIRFIAQNLRYFRSFRNILNERIKRRASESIELSYKILNMFCNSHEVNQGISHKHLANYLQDIGLDLGCQQLLIEIFKNNKECLPLIRLDPSGEQGNLIKRICWEFSVKNRNKGEQKYWPRLIKIIRLFNTFIFYGNNPLDINQFIISEQLFRHGSFEPIFIPIRVQAQRICVQLSTDAQFELIENVKDKEANKAIYAVFQLFTNLVLNHSINSKTHIHNYLASYNQACLTTMINYLNRPLKKELYSAILNFIAQCYIDSAPRLSRQTPLSFIFFNFQEELTNVQVEEAYMSQRLREMSMLKAEQSRVCKPLHYSNSISIGNINEPTITEQQLVSFRLGLTQKILNSSACDGQQLETVGLLMKLECYTTNQILQLSQQFKAKLVNNEIEKKLIPKLLFFFQKIFLLAQELQIKKMKTFLLNKFQLKQNLKESQYNYVLPLSKRAPLPLLDKNTSTSQNVAVHEPDVTHRSLLSKDYLAEYNELRDTLELMHASKELQKSLMDYFCEFGSLQAKMSQQLSSQYLSSIFKMIVHFNLPKYQFLKLITKSTILTHEEVSQFDRLFDLSKRLQYLVLVSQNWLVQDSNPDCAGLFIDIMTEITGFLFDETITPRSRWTPQTLQSKKQLLMGNLKVHNAVFEFLEKNVYLLKVSKKQLKKKHRESFIICFDFIYWLIKQCPQNKRNIYEFISILLMYQDCLEIGQTKAYTEFYRDEKDFAKEMSFSVIEGLINKIVKSGSKVDECGYNPDYIGVLIVIIEALDIENKFFIEKLYKYIIKPEVFNRLLFLDEPKENNKHFNFCLKLHRIRLDPIQIPILYHLRLLQLFRIVFQNCSEVIRNSLKLKFSQLFEIEYLLSLLAEPDIFSNSGVTPQLNFLLKGELISFLSIFLQKNDVYSQLYESDALMSLLQFYSRILLKKEDRKETTNESESLFIPFVEEHSEFISLYQNNKSLYYLEYIGPLIAKLVAIFEKQTRTENNKIKNYLLRLAEALKDAYSSSAIKRATTQGQHGIKDIKLKWRNFVDDDQDNSEEEKYAKKNVLDILKSKPAASIIEKELNHFYSSIKERSKEFVISMMRLLKMLFESRQISDGRRQEGKIAQEAMKYLSGYIKCCDEKETRAVIELLEKEGYIQIILNLFSQKEFELTKMHLKNIFYYCLSILNFMLEQDKHFQIQKALLKRFNQHLQANKFLQFLREGAFQIIASVDSHHYYQQINVALQEMRLCADNQPILLFEESFHTLTLLCKHQPFTSFLRKQQFGDIDFLDKIYNILTFLFKSSKDIHRNISISSVRASEYILDFVSSMFTGKNATNQNYIVQNKYVQFVNQILKLQRIEAPSRQPAREQLLIKIVEFYHSNGIEIGDLLQSKIKLIDFRQLYLLNRFKYILIKTLLQCMIGNMANETKVKIELPIQIVKLNLIWIYQNYKKCGSEYKEEYILRKREHWPLVVQLFQDKANEQPGQVSRLRNELFLRLGFYFYQIIQVYERDKQEDQAGESQQKVVNEEKEKQRVVRKFFARLRDHQRLKQNQQSFSNETLGEQMKYLFHVYYNALQFFKEKTSTIELNFKGEIIRAYFPRLPIAQKINEEMRQQFKQNAVRISRDQKIKSLFEWENNFYEDLEGEDQFFVEIEEKSPIFGKVLRIMQYQNEFLFIGWFSSLILSLAFLIQNYQEPSFELMQQFFEQINITEGKPIHIVMLLLSLINLFLGIVLGFYLFIRKIPLKKRLLSLKFAKLKEAGQQANQISYVWGNIVSESIYNLYIVAFLCLSIVHPFFSAFPLIEIIRRIEMGRFIVQSLRETWFQMFVTTGLLIVFNIVYVQITYQFFTDGYVYGEVCKTSFACALMINDFNLKAGQGFLGVVSSDYSNMVLTPQVLYEIFYILISLKVIFEIFSGTIIDKFSELREREESIEEDESKVCFICGEERFDLDLEYEGFQPHIEENHNSIHYIEYLFYLRRCQTRQYGIIQRYITDCRQRQSQQWMPELNSICKQDKSRQEEQSKELDAKDKFMNFCKEKANEVRRMSLKVEGMIKQLKEMKKEDKQEKEVNQRMNQ